MQTFPNAGNSQYPNLPKCKNDLVETISREDFAWLAGIIDGEGCIGLYKSYKKNDRDGSQGGKNKWMIMKRFISINNNDVALIKKVSEIYYALGIKFYYRLKNRKNPNHKKTLAVIVEGQGSCKKLLTKIYPYLVAKKEEAKLLIEFVDLRKRKIQLAKRNCHSPKIKYGQEEENYLEQLKKLKDKEINPQRLQRRASQPLKLR